MKKQNQAERMKAVYHQLKRDHQCTKCSVKLADDWPYVMCAACQEARRTYYRGYRILCRKLGRCISCGRLVGDRNHSTCEVCREKMRQQTRKRREKKK